MQAQSRSIKPGQVWRHYKHDPNGVPNNYTYTIIALACHTETEETLVIYEPLYDASDWLGKRGLGETCAARPLSMFLDHIERETYTGPRFVRVK